MTENLRAVGLPNRAVVKISGADARSFLDTLLTNSMAGVDTTRAIHTALLTPQGKLVTDFFIIEAAPEDGGGFYCDVPLVTAAELVKRLGFYKLRANVTLEDLSEDLGVLAFWGETGLPLAELSLAFADPRLAALGSRMITHKSQQAAAIAELGAEMGKLAEYHLTRADLGLGEAVFDYTPGNTFPHEINMDQLHGIDFKKGCYIGQEVVSRMQHRGTARTRLVPMRYEDNVVVMEGVAVMAGEKKLGQTSSPGRKSGLATLRLDRVAEAMTQGTPIIAGGVIGRVVKPTWWTADWPLPTESRHV